MKKIKLIEPFYKGSHKYWCDRLIQFSQHQIDLSYKNGVFWKWRLAQSAVEFSLPPDHNYHIILSTNMVNLAAWSGVNRKNIGTAKLVHYFHENQLSYPKKEKEDNSFFGFMDITSAACADQVIFNSKFHKNSFVEAVKKLSKKLPDKIPANLIEEIASKSHILPIGIDIDSFLQQKRQTKNEVPVILWNHRHEFDKNPELFFKTLFKLKEDGVNFKLVVLGHAPKNSPEIFKEAKEKLRDHILQWGSVESKKEYIQWLWQADILPVTSNHDFFGISVLEAALCENKLLLPKANAYPDHFPVATHGHVYYEDADELYIMLKESLLQPSQNQAVSDIVLKYSWDVVIKQYDEFLENL